VRLFEIALRLRFLARALMNVPAAETLTTCALNPATPVGDEIVE